MGNAPEVLWTSVTQTSPPPDGFDELALDWVYVNEKGEAAITSDYYVWSAGERRWRKKYRPRLFLSIAGFVVIGDRKNGKDREYTLSKIRLLKKSGQSMPISPGTKTLTINLDSITPSQAPIVDGYIRLIVVLKSVSGDGGVVSVHKHFDWVPNRWINTDTIAEEMSISGYSLGKNIGGLIVVSITLSR